MSVSLCRGVDREWMLTEASGRVGTRGAVAPSLEFLDHARNQVSKLSLGGMFGMSRFRGGLTDNFGPEHVLLKCAPLSAGHDGGILLCCAIGSKSQVSEMYNMN